MVKHLLEDLDILGFGKTKFVMDRGFYSEDNINGLYLDDVHDTELKRSYDLPIRVLHVVIRFCIMLLCNGPLTPPPGPPMDRFGAIYFIGGE